MNSPSKSGLGTIASLSGFHGTSRCSSRAVTVNPASRSAVKISPSPWLKCTSGVPQRCPCRCSFAPRRNTTPSPRSHHRPAGGMTIAARNESCDLSFNWLGAPLISTALAKPPTRSYQPFTPRETTHQTSPQRRLIEGLTAYIGGCGPGGSQRLPGQLAEDVVEGDDLTVSTVC